jgi:Rrf2 family protein
MPERFLLQILRVLVTHGILKSTRGVEGGYSLSRSPEAISLLEVIEAIDGPLTSAADPAAVEPPVDVQQMLQTALRQVTDTARIQLEAIKLSQLLPPPALPTASFATKAFEPHAVKPPVKPLEKTFDTAENETAEVWVAKTEPLA